MSGLARRLAGQRLLCRQPGRPIRGWLAMRQPASPAWHHAAENTVLSRPARRRPIPATTRTGSRELIGGHASRTPVRNAARGNPKVPIFLTCGSANSQGPGLGRAPARQNGQAPVGCLACDVSEPSSDIPEAGHNPVALSRDLTLPAPNIMFPPNQQNQEA
jgi:hypothetical protein